MGIKNRNLWKPFPNLSWLAYFASEIIYSFTDASVFFWQVQNNYFKPMNLHCWNNNYIHAGRRGTFPIDKDKLNENEYLI